MSYRNPPDMTGSPIEYHVIDWLTSLKASGLAARSQSLYRYYAHCFAYWWRENRSGVVVEKFGRRDCEAFLAYLQSPNPARWGAAHSKQSKDVLAPASLILIVRTVKLFFKWLAADDVIEVSPWAKVRFNVKVDKTAPPKSLTDVEVKKLFKYLSTRHKGEREYNRVRNLAMFALLLDTGGRREELLNLTLADVDLDAGQAHIRHGKGNKARVVLFDSKTKTLLADYLNDYRLHQDTELTGALFFTEAGTALTADGLAGCCAYLRKRTGIAGLHPHAFRHTFAAVAVERMNIYKVRDLMGHSSVTMTEWYARSSQKAIAKEYRGNSPMSVLGVDVEVKRGRGRPRKYQE